MENIKYIINDTNEKSRFFKVLTLIPEGRENAISMKELSLFMGISKRDIRALILEARMEGNIIAGDSFGYYIPLNEEELKSYYFQAKGRLISCSRSLKSVRNKLKESGVPV